MKEGIKVKGRYVDKIRYVDVVLWSNSQEGLEKLKNIITKSERYAWSKSTNVKTNVSITVSESPSLIGEVIYCCLGHLIGTSSYQSFPICRFLYFLLYHQSFNSFFYSYNVSKEV